METLGVQIDLQVVHAKDNPLDVHSVGVSAGVSGSVTANFGPGLGGGVDPATYPRGTNPVQDFITHFGKYSAGLTGNATTTVRWERNIDQPPPQAVPKNTSFTPLNHGDPATARQIADDLLDGVASVRFPDNTTVDRVQVGRTTSIWDLPRKAGSLSFGQPALELANSVNAELQRAGLLGAGQFIDGPHALDQARSLLEKDFAATRAAGRADELADKLANTIGINFGVAELDAANAGLEARQGRAADTAYYAQFFLTQDGGALRGVLPVHSRVATGPPGVSLVLLRSAQVVPQASQASRSAKGAAGRAGTGNARGDGRARGKRRACQPVLAPARRGWGTPDASERRRQASPCRLFARRRRGTSRGASFATRAGPP